MILNTYAVLAGFVAALRLLLGLLVAGLGVWAWRRGGRGAAARDALEDRSYLVFLLAVLLVALNLASWPLLYALLQSYVPEWSAVMCIYGVMRVGEDSLGPSRFLPGLLRLLQLTRPALVFAGGAWFVLYLLNRRTATAPLLGRLFVVLLPLGALAAADAMAELAYLAIPKKEEFPSGGCCTATSEGGGHGFLSEGVVGPAGRPWLVGAYYGGHLAVTVALALAARRGRAPPGAAGLGLLVLGGLAVLAVTGLFLVEVAAPALLGLPYHHCPYDLIPQAPEAVVAVALHLAGCFCLGWAGVALWLGRCPQTEAVLPGVVRGLLWLCLWGYLASFAMLNLELALA